MFNQLSNHATNYNDEKAVFSGVVHSFSKAVDILSGLFFSSFLNLF